jgi:peptidoglycan-N-acetylglucosamine deacetylase
VWNEEAAVRTAAQYAAALRWRLEARPWWRSFPPLRLKDLPRSQVDYSSAVALTFDDGPDARYTPSILATLSDRDVRATFFLCGLAAEREPDLVRDIAREGHTIAGHTWHHVDVSGLAEDSWQQEVTGTHGLLEALTGQSVRYFRPPWSLYDDLALERLARDGLLPVLFSSMGFDWANDDPLAITREVARSLQPGAIVLLHDGCGDLLQPGGSLRPGSVEGRAATVAALPDIIDAVEAAGLHCVALPR